MASLTQLQYVVALDQTRHFGRAATRCHISQPTLSAQLRKLEEEIGVVLFDRNKQPILPTEDGKAFIEQAKVILTEYKRFEQLASHKADDLTGEFRLAFIPTVAPYLMPLFLPDFSRRYPKIELIIQELPTEKIIEALDKEQLDAGILATPLGLSRIAEDVLYFEPFFVYAGLNHPLAKKETISEGHLKREDLWLLSDEHCLRQQVIEVCGGSDRGGCFPSVHLHGSSIETVVEMVSRGQGYTLLPQLAAQSVASRRSAGSIIPLSKPVPAREISVAHRRGHLKQMMMQRLKARIEANLPAQLPRVRSKGLRIVDLVGVFR